MDALSNVIDPELGLDFVELGLIYGVEIDEGNVRVTFTLTTPGCPIGPQVNEQIEEFVGELDGVRTVESEMVFTPAVVAGDDERGRQVRARLLRAAGSSPAASPARRVQAVLAGAGTDSRASETSVASSAAMLSPIESMSGSASKSPSSPKFIWPL